MPINNLKAFLNDPIVGKLLLLSASLEKADQVFTEGQFSRSPYHLIKFLIIYAALSPENRSKTHIKINKLATDYSNPMISQQELDDLIQKMDWSALLDKTNTSSNIHLALQIELASPDHFFVDAKKNCPRLHGALQSPQSIVRVYAPDGGSKSLNEIIFRTVIKQTDEWTKSFCAKEQGWKVDKFNLSSAFLSKIQIMASQKELISGFEVIRGTLPGYELYLPEPPDKEVVAEWQFGETNGTYSKYIDGDYLIKEALSIQPQIYDCLKGLTDVFGLLAVDTVIVTIENEGNFTTVGVEAKQADEVVLGEGCVPRARGIVNQPTHIIAHGLNVMLRESGISAQFLKNPDDPLFDETIYILLETKSGSEVLLMNAKPDPIQSLTMPQCKSIQ